jgi:hypothetical protein
VRLAALVSLGLVLAYAACGCATPEPPKEEPRSEMPRPKEPPQRAPVVQAGRYLIYQVEWLNAEEVAETMRPILESRYGPGVNIVPHIPTNKLIIYIPSRREQEMVRAQGGAPGVPAQTAPGMQTRGTQTTRGTGPGSTTSGTQSASRRRSLAGSR